MLEKTPLFAESWNVAWRDKGQGSILHDTSTTFKVIKNSIRYWAADPFVFEFQGKTFIFAELYDYILRRGVIGYYCLSDGKKAKWKPVIVEDYHLSFPNIFVVGKDIFIMPESNAADQLYLYKASAFPDKWKKYSVIRKSAKYADTVCFEADGRKYALTYDVKNPINPSFRLLDIENEENDCDLNLPSINLRRPAGKMLTDLKIRPAQDCEEDYGKGLLFYQYQFHNGKYTEEEILRLTPSDIYLSEYCYLDGMHTYNCSNNYEVIDIKTRRFNIINLFFRFISKIRW